MEKFQISVKNWNNLWRFIEIYAIFVLNLCGENLCGEKMTNMRSGDFVKLCTTRHIWLVASYHKHRKKANRSNKDVLELTLKGHGLE